MECTIRFGHGWPSRVRFCAIIRIWRMSVKHGLALVFDLDGVIVDSNPIHRAVWRRYLRSCGRETPAGFDEWMYGKRNDEIVRRVFGDQLRQDEVLSHGAAKEKLFRRELAAGVGKHLVAGLEYFLNRHRGTPMAVASNAERANVEFVLASAGLTELFAAVISGDQVTRPKPDPEIYLQVAARLGVAPGNTIVFEDSAAGVGAARSAGARVVGVTTTHAELARVDFLAPDFSVPELNTWVESQEPL